MWSALAQTQEYPPIHRNVVICGGGIIGASIAYYLSKRGVASTIIERSAVAAAASGAGWRWSFVHDDDSLASFGRVA